MSTRLSKDLIFHSRFVIITLDLSDTASMKGTKMVLIVDTLKRNAQAISDIFYYMGVLSYATTPYEALSEISGMYRAVLVHEPEKLPDAEGFLEKIRLYNSSIPIFAMTDAALDQFPRDSFDKCFAKSIYSSSLVEHIVSYQKERRLPMTAYYRLAGIDASCDKARVNCFDKALNFTKTETMLLRYLIASYPSAGSAKDIIKYAFKPSRKPEITSIRTHISVMNKKFRKITGKNLFINIPNQGYAVSTPQILGMLRQEEAIQSRF